MTGTPEALAEQYAENVFDSGSFGSMGEEVRAAFAAGYRRGGREAPNPEPNMTRVWRDSTFAAAETISRLRSGLADALDLIDLPTDQQLIEIVKKLRAGAEDTP